MNPFFHLLGRYTHWLHTQWPAGTVEKLPQVREDGTCSLPGAYIVGDLTGIPLLKFAADSGARAVQAIAQDQSWTRTSATESTVDLAIIGAGVSGLSAALEAKRQGLRFVLFEATQSLSTIANFPKGKAIYTFPTAMVPTGNLQLTAKRKEELLTDLEGQRSQAGIEITPLRIDHLSRQGGRLHLHHADKQNTTQAQRVIIATGRSGNFRALGVPGEQLPKVFNRLHDPQDFHGQQVLVIGGGDSAMEAAIALTGAGAHVTLSYRSKEFSRVKPDNLSMLHAIEQDAGADVGIMEPSSERVTTATGPLPLLRGRRSLLGSHLQEIHQDSVRLQTDSGTTSQLPNQAVFAMIGREAPLEFFRRSGINLRGEWRTSTWISFSLFMAACFFLYLWKGGTSLNIAFQNQHWFPYNLSAWFTSRR
jgi:NosR/NirI family transcriptional regulator, nitrous oxide reductase regulator